MTSANASLSRSSAGAPNAAADAALISVYDRTGIAELAAALAAGGVPIYATGGTRKHLAAAGIAVDDVGDLTGFPALFDGRVKTLHPNVFGGILADRANPQHVAEAQRYGVPAIGTVVVVLMSMMWAVCARVRKSIGSRPRSPATGRRSRKRSSRSMSAASRCCAPRPKITPMSAC